MFTKLLTNSKGVLVLTVGMLNTTFWFIPLISFTVLKLLVPIAAFRRVMTQWIMAMGENWITVNALILDWVNGTRYTVTGLEDLSRSRWYLLLVNHQTWVDILALQTVFNRNIPFLKFFVKRQLVWLPVVGIALWALDMPFMSRYSKAYLRRHPEKKGKDLEMTRKACEKFHATPTSVINFVEGTRFSEDKRERRDSAFLHLLPPRSGGVAVTLSSMGEMFDAILDTTIYYPHGVPTFWDSMCGRFKEVEIHIRQQPIDPWIVQGDYARDRTFRRDFHRWLTEFWERKDAKLAALRAADPNKPGR